MNLNNMELIHDKLLQIKAFVFDVDGVFTDGSVIATENGEFLRTFNIKDGYAIQHAIKSEYPIAIISGGSSEGVRKRFEMLGVKEIYLGQKNKTEAFQLFLNKHNLSAKDIAYMGDDIPDLLLLKEVGFSCSPKDAAIDILNVVDYISPIEGGKGCVRELIEKTMKLQNKWWHGESYSW